MDPQGKPLEGTFGQQSFDLMEDEFQTGIGSEIEMKPGWQELQQSRDVWLANQPVVVDESVVKPKGNQATRFLSMHILSEVVEDFLTWEELQALFSARKSEHKQYRSPISEYLESALKRNSEEDIIPGWTLTDEGIERIKKKPEPKPVPPVPAEPKPTLERFGTMSDLLTRPVKPEPVEPFPGDSTPFNATTVVLDDVVKGEDEESNLLSGLSDNVVVSDPIVPIPPDPYFMPTLEHQFDEVDVANVLPGFVAPDPEQPQDEDVVELRRSTRKVAPVSYEDTIDDDDIVARRVSLLQNIMRYVPQELKAQILDELQYFGAEDQYIVRDQFDCDSELKQNLQFPADIWGVGDEVNAAEHERKSMYELMGVMLEQMDDRLYKQFAVALMWKHTIHVLSQLSYQVDDEIWRTGQGAQSDRVVQQLQQTAVNVNTLFLEIWPENFMEQPTAFPGKTLRNLGDYADRNIEFVQKGALQVDRSVREYKEENLPLAEEEEDVLLPGPAGPEEELPEEKAGEVGDLSIATRIRNELLEAIRERVVPPPPPPPPPIEVHIVQEKKGPDDNVRWAFGLALSLWVVYNMN